MLTESQAKEFARRWIEAWNSHDLDAIMRHYDSDVVLTSPVASQVLNDLSGTIKGSAALRSYFKRGLELYPNLQFELIDVMCGLSSIVLYYRNRRARRPVSSWNLPEMGKLFAWLQTTASKRLRLMSC